MTAPPVAIKRCALREGVLTLPPSRSTVCLASAIAEVFATIKGTATASMAGNPRSVKR